MPTTSPLGVSVVSSEVIDAVARVSREDDIRLMLVASVNQVGHLPGEGYASDAKTLVERVAHANKHGASVEVWRDHCGPGFRDGDDGWAIDELAKPSAIIEADVQTGFDGIHIDGGRGSDPRSATRELIGVFKSVAGTAQRQVGLEVGTEDNTGQPVPVDTFRGNLDFITEQCDPTFVVGQTGSLVMGQSQIGSFRASHVRRLVDLAHSYGVAFKEHNADYLGRVDRTLRRAAGVDAINIGPELGVLQSKLVVLLADERGLGKAADAFLSTSEQSGAWRKWSTPGLPRSARGFVAGHYNFLSEAYLGLVGQLSEVCPVEELISAALVARLREYLGTEMCRASESTRG